MNYVAAILAAAVFGLAFRLLRIVPVAREVVAVSRGAVACMRDSAITDLEKERTMQKASLSLLRGFVSILGRGLIAFAAATILVILLDALGFIRAPEVVDLLSTWQGIGLTSAAMILVWSFHSRR